MYCPSKAVTLHLKFYTLDRITHLDRLDLSANKESFVLNGLPQLDALLHRDLLALTPDDSYHVKVTEADDDCRYD